MEQRITAITPQKRKTHRVNIHLDGKFAFSLSKLVAAWLQPGMVLDDEKISQLRSEDEHEAAYQRAINWISYRPRTEEEIRRRMHRLSIPEDVIQAVIDRLKRNELVNDKHFVERWVEERSLSRPRSQKALVYELRQHGVQPEFIQDAVLHVDDSEMAYQAVIRKTRKTYTTEWNEFRQKMLRYLAGRGFSYEISSEVVRRVWEEKSKEDNNNDERAET